MTHGVLAYLTASPRRVLLMVLASYALLTGVEVHTTIPHADEAWLASPAYNLNMHGHMGTSLLDETSTWGKLSFQGLNSHTYQVMPLHFVVQAAWYRVTGFGLTQMRLLSMLFGLFALVSCYLLVRKLTNEEWPAILTAAFLAVDGVFLDASALGRSDMIAAAFAFGALAAYVNLREARMTLAVFVANALLACAVFTHLAAGPAGIAFLFLVLFYDLKRIRIQHILVGAIPYIVVGGCWILYILQDTAAFQAQFGSNFGGRIGGRSPSAWRLMSEEFTRRYLPNFGFAPNSSPLGRLKLVVLGAYVASAIGSIATPGLRKQKGYLALIVLAGLYVAVVTVESTKQAWYLVQVIPWLSALLAGWLCWIWRSRSVPRAVIAVAITGIFAIQLGRAARLAYKDSMHRLYRPAAEFVQANVGKDEQLFASATFAFTLGFDRTTLVDDLRLGLRTGKTANVIVIDERYQDFFNNAARSEPATMQYVGNLLAQYRIVYDHPPYRIYQRQ